MASRDNARKFHFLREIASGGFGSVYLAKVMHADGFSRLVAIKLLHRRWSENKEIAQRMRDEARLLGWLRHRNIVDVIDLTSIDGRAAVIMEYLEAVDVKTVIQALADKGERMPPYAALEIVAFVASALDAAYNRPPYEGEKPLRVIHRDIKPSNIMVDESGTVKVLDFGVARGEFENRESHTQELQFGSVEYMPPERLFFEPETDRADVYSLGASLFEILTGERLGKAKGRAEKHATFLEDRLSFLAASCPLPNPQGGEVARFVREMCAYNADNRPRSEEVVTRARQLARQMPGPALTEWAEGTVKPLVIEAQRAPREPNPITDAVMGEDSQIFGGAELAASTAGEAPTVAPAPPKPAAPAAKPAAPPKPAAKATAAPPPPPTPAPEVPRGDSRWDLLRQAALEEMGALPEAPADAEDFGDEPTRIGTATPALMAAIAASTPNRNIPVTTGPSSLPGASAPMPRALAAEKPASPPVSPPAPSAPAIKPPPAPAVKSVAPVPAVGSATSSPMPRAARAAPPVAAPPAPAPTIAPPRAAEPAPAAAPAPAAEKPGPAAAKPPEPAARTFDDLEDPPAPEEPATLNEQRFHALPPALALLPELLPGVLDPPSAEELKPQRAAAAAERAAGGLREQFKANHTIVPDDEAFPEPASSANTTYPIPVSAPPPRPAPAPRPVAISSPPVAPPRPAPPATDPFADEPSTSGGRGWLLAVGVVAVLVFLGLMAGGAVMAWRYYSMSAVETAVPAVAATAPLATAPPTPAAPAVLGPDDVRFVSAEAARSMIVDCGSGEVSGTNEVVIKGPVKAGCLVTLVKQDRSRLRAELDKVSPGTFTCFAADSKSCAR